MTHAILDNVHIHLGRLMTQVNLYVQFLFMWQILAMDAASALLKEPWQPKLFAKFNESGSAERIGVYLVN